MKWAWAVVWLAAAGPAQTQILLDYTDQEVTRIVSHGPWPPAPLPDLSNRADGQAAAVTWGRELFSDATLSAQGRFSCATCHLPAQAFQDNRPTAAGRIEGQSGRRNTPSLLDSAQRRWLGWDGAHDSLWAASLAPLLADDEMAGSPAALAARVRADPKLRCSYRDVFGSDVPADDDRVMVDIAKVLAAYQATLVSPRTAFDDFRDALQRGDRRAAAAYPIAAQRGLRLFIGTARCSVCHAGPYFTNGEFADIGIPFFLRVGVDPGRHGGLQKLQASGMNRLGAFNDARTQDPRAVTTRHVTLEPRHFGEFRVPGLRQLTHTAPYMHNGSLVTIESVVRHYAELDEDRLHADGERILRRLNLTPGESADLAAFLRTLSR